MKLRAVEFKRERDRFGGKARRIGRSRERSDYGRMKKKERVRRKSNEAEGTYRKSKPRKEKEQPKKGEEEDVAGRS